MISLNLMHLVKLFKNNGRNTIQKPSNNIYESDQNNQVQVISLIKKRKQIFRKLQKKY